MSSSASVPPVPASWGSWGQRLPVRQPTPVASLADAGRWVEHNLAVMLDQCVDRDSGEDAGQSVLQRLAACLGHVTISTAFSGTGGPENALHALECGLQHFSGVDLRRAGRSCFVVEWAPESAMELQMLAHPPQHLHTDMTHCLKANIRGPLQETANRMSFDDLHKIIKTRRAISPTMYCELHKKECVCEQAPGMCKWLPSVFLPFMPQLAQPVLRLPNVAEFAHMHTDAKPYRKAFLHCAGTPCVAFSAQGKREAASGATLLAFMSWAGQRLMLQEQCILHENVQQFGVNILEDIFSEFYLIESVVVCCSDLGSARTSSASVIRCVVTGI